MESNGFELVCAITGDGDIPVSKYRSTKTGMQVVIADVDGPVVNGYLCFATEAHDHDGLPHTLEHLVFMGSEDYPFKGVLDLLANRCLASGTNAWTDVDHTCYTMTTAGYQGFLNLLPIYLDHVLYPTLSDSAFTTEVHHVNGEGEDAGVVYCEMQARENTGESRCHLAFMAAMYPGVCGYKSETGGLMKNLRESTTNGKIHAYHHTFYRPDNLCVIIAGKVAPAEVFRSLKPFEAKVVSKGPLPKFEKPWQSPVPPLTSSVDQVIRYPCDDEDHGLVYVGWRGPEAKEFGKIVALTVLMDYLTETAVSPLQQEFVETDDPYCSQVGYSVCENSVSCVILYFQSVLKDKLNLIKVKLMELLNKIATGVEDLDMKLMTTMIRRKKLNILSQMETNPHDTIAFDVIGDFLYGETADDLRQRLNHVPIVDQLFNRSKNFWIELLKQYIVGVPTVVIIGEPSTELMKEMQDAEKDRILKQRETLGEDGLKQKAHELQSATEANEVEAPSEMLAKVAVPSISSIQFHQISRSHNRSEDALNNIPEFSLEGLPYTFQLDDIHTNFVTMFVLLDTSKVPCNLRLYLPLFMELIMESPVLKDNELLSYEEVVAQLTADTVHSATSLGLQGGSQFFCGHHAQIAALEIKVEEEKYATGVKWLKNLLVDSRFTSERIQVVATKMINNVSQMKRSGSTISNMIMNNLCFVQDSNHWASSFIRQHKFLGRVVERLATESDKVISDLEALRCLLTHPDNLTVHMSANVSHLANKCNPRDPWLKEFTWSQEKRCNAGSTGVQCYQLLKTLVIDCEDNNAITGVGAVESSFLIQTVEGIKSFSDPDFPKLLVLIQYLTQLEGPMWRQIRGQGLSYHYSISVKPNKGLIYFVLYKSTHLLSAYKEAKSIVEKHLNGEEKWDQMLFESSKSSLIFELIEKGKSAQDVSLQSLLAYYRDIDIDYIWKLLDMISKVTTSEFQSVGSKYLAPLFDPAFSRCAICCHPSKVDEMRAGFKELSKNLKIISSIDDSFLGEFSVES